MIVTFLIGNGFDLNLGLKTRYTDFLEEYLAKSTSDEDLQNFKAHIKSEEKLWSQAEIALGKYTGQIETGRGEIFSKCHKDICEELAAYLKRQESCIDFESNAELFSRAFSRINRLTNHFVIAEKNALDATFGRYRGQTIGCNFISYNYTYTLNRCLEIAKKSSTIFGPHHGNAVRKYQASGFVQVHGSVEDSMIFGVNDASQIEKPDIFDCEDGDLYKQILIKQKANESFGENKDVRASQMIRDSQIIYIYGMSIGETDRLWWERCCSWLVKDSARHIILHCFDVPEKGVFQTDYQKYERRQRRRFLSLGNVSGEKIANVEQRIHITNDNIFAEIESAAVAKRSTPVEEENPA